MNSVRLIGRLTRDPMINRSSLDMSVAHFQIAIERPKKSGESKKVDYPRIVIFGKAADNCKKYLKQGSLVGIEGNLRTGSYTNGEGNIIYTTNVYGIRIKYLDSKEKHIVDTIEEYDDIPESILQGIPEGFQAIEYEDIPD